jgi:crotonobetainyl-CoA:carnitine CoA-transferase CaiB-like acyl-CoA transferase
LDIAWHDAWPALVAVADLDPSWAKVGQRPPPSRGTAIEAALASWTADQDPDELTERLQAAAVAAHTVQHSAEVIADPQLLHRGTPVQVPHPRYGQV